MDKFFEDQLLYDYYGSLLTDHQKEVMSLYYEDDLGLSEISERLSSSRQAVYDTIQRSLKLLRNFEEHLGLIKKEDEIKPLFTELTEIIESCLKQDKEVDKIKKNLEQCLEIIKSIQNEM